MDFSITSFPFFLNRLTDSPEFMIIAKILLTFVLGGIIGFERELKRKPVGIKTCIIISVTTCVLTIVSIQAAEYYASISENIRTDPMRLAAQVISGIGFLGAGVILHKSDDAISGLTTAAIVWASAGIGIAIGASFYFEAIIATIMILCAIYISPLLQKIFSAPRVTRIKFVLHLSSPQAIGDIINELIALRYKLSAIAITDLYNGEVKLSLMIGNVASLNDLYLFLKTRTEVLAVNAEC